MKKYMFGPLLVAVGLFLVFLFFPNKWLTALITDKKINESATSLDATMFQGKYLQQKALESDKYLPMYGSSELNRLDIFHPANYFKANNQGYDMYLIGRGGMQSFVHSLNFATQANTLKGKKIVFVISPQWFDKDGLDVQHFGPNFTKLQAYDLYFNHTISEKLKKKAMKRLLDFDEVKRDQILAPLYKNELHSTSKTKLEARFSKPIAYTNLLLLNKKDLYYSVFQFKIHHSDKDISAVKNKNWDQLKEIADKEGERQTAGSNPYYIKKSYYNFHIKDVVKEKKGYLSQSDFSKSPEYADFKLMLDILKEQKAKPLFISMPVNGRWYDYGGYPKERRQKYYQKVDRLVKQRGFEIKDYSNHDYDPYFMKDTIHIGWKGWVYVDKDIQSFMK